MKIYYVSFIRFPSEKAHSLYVTKACGAFADLEKNTVQVVVPKRFSGIKTPYSKFYGVSPTFSVKRLPCIDLFQLPWLKKITFFIAVGTFAISCYVYSIFKIPRSAIIFSDNNLLALLLTYTNKRVIYELHDYPQGSLWLYRRLLKRVYKIQTNNHQKQTLLHEQFQVPKSKLYTAHNGVTLGDFDIQLSKIEARTSLGLDNTKKIVVYTGHLYDWKGADVLADAAIRLPDVTFLFVGGSDEDVQKMKAKYRDYSNICFLGFKPHKEMPVYQRAADVLVVPNTAKKDISRLHTSPMKIFEYMASKTLIVASDLPSIREILNNDNAILCKPDDPEDMARVISAALSLAEKQKQMLTNNAFITVRQHTWQVRAERIIKHIGDKY